MKPGRTLFTIILILLFSLPGGARHIGSVLQEFESREGSGWTFHRFTDGTVRAMYGPGTERRLSDANDAKQFLADYVEMFQIDDLSSLRLQNLDKDEFGASYEFQQYASGIPVLGGNLSIHTDSEGRMIAANGQYHSMRELATGSIRSAADARATASRFRYADAGLSDGTLVVVPATGNPRIGWRFIAMSQEFPGTWAIYIDAISPNKVLRIHKLFADLEGTGTVFRENQVVTPELSKEPFLYLDDSTSLSGKFVKTFNGNFALPFRRTDLSGFTTASEPDLDFTYPTSDAKFTEAMAYYHMNVVHDRWRSFGFKKLNFQFPIFVNVVSASGNGFDNAFYTRGGLPPVERGAIVMGSGNFFNNFGHDADVYYHEYGHAVLDRAKPRLIETVESQYPFAFHEGFGDISSSAITGNPKLAEFALSSKETGKFRGRNLENKNRFPRDVILKGFGKSESHHTGLIVGGAWWDLQQEIGSDKAQEILFKSLAILPNEMNFFDVRNSMLTADLRRNRGANAEAIRTAFAKHGLSGDDPGQTGKMQLRSLNTALINFSNFNIKIKSTFKQGDLILVVANYSATDLTPGYNLVVTELQLIGPENSNPFVFPIHDEVVNGLRTRKAGAWVAEIITDESSKPGLYTFTIKSRLGGTTTFNESKSVKFRIKE